MDDNFVTVRKRVFEIRDELRRRKLRVAFAFPNGVRADYLDAEVLQALKDMGTYSISFGVESGNQDILNRAKKTIDLKQVESAFAMAKRLKIETWALLMLGLPGETPQTIQQTIDFVNKLDPDVAKFHTVKPFPGTELYDELKSRGLLLSDNYDDFGIHTPPVHRLEGLSPEEMLAWQKKAYRDFYFTPRRILRQVLRIKSWNRLVLNLKAGWSVFKIAFS